MINIKDLEVKRYSFTGWIDALEIPLTMLAKLGLNELSTPDCEGEFYLDWDDDQPIVMLEGFSINGFEVELKDINTDWICDQIAEHGPISVWEEDRLGMLTDYAFDRAYDR